MTEIEQLSLPFLQLSSCLDGQKHTVEMQAAHSQFFASASKSAQIYSPSGIVGVGENSSG